MSATIQSSFGSPRMPLERDLPSGYLGLGRSNRRSAIVTVTEPGHQWLVDLAAVARCRALFARQGNSAPSPFDESRHSQQSLMEVPAAYDQFCRSHFTSVKRLHPDLQWEDACPAYVIALSAHAVLCEALDEEREKLLELNWQAIRGQSRLPWAKASKLIADGCSALTRIDPLAMRR